MDDCPDEDPSEYKENSHGHSQGCDLLARYFKDQIPKSHRIVAWSRHRGLGSYDEKSYRNCYHGSLHHPQSHQSPEKILDSLTWVILHKRIALEYFLAAPEGVCAIPNTSCCTWENTSQQVVLETTPLLKLAKSLKGHLSFTPRGLILSFLIFLA